MSASTGQPRYDVFVSYSHRDRDWVVGELLPRLESAGVQVCIDYRDFEPGKAILHNIRDAISRSRHTVVVMSPDWAASEWAGYETILIRSGDPAGLTHRTIPLLRQQCAIPEELALLTHIDFTRGANQDLAWHRLFAALDVRAEPASGDDGSRKRWLLAHPYPMPPNFTGRAMERSLLSAWLAEDAAHPVLALRALGGFGKSALSWHWLLHDVPPQQWPRVVWWSFYESDATFDVFLAESVRSLGGGRGEDGPATPRQQLDALIRALQAPGTLLVLDGFERALRVFAGLGVVYRGDDTVTADSESRECISPLADLFLRSVATLPGVEGKVLLTTRLRPAALEARGGILLHGCREEDLAQLRSEDAVDFLRAQGVRGERRQLDAACEAYGYHPLSLRLLAGWIGADLEQPGDIAAARRLDISGDLVQRQHHVLEHAFDSLQPGAATVLECLSCFRGPVSYEVLKRLAAEDASAPATDDKRPFIGALLNRRPAPRDAATPPGPIEVLQSHLRDLIARGLVFHDLKARRFDLHPIVRRYAYERLTMPDRLRTHARLRDYFAAVPAPGEPSTLDDLAPVVELYHHTVRAGEYDDARALFRERLNQPTYDQFGAYQLRIDLLRGLFPDGEDRPSRLRDRSHEGWALNALANSYSLSGQLRRALPLYERQLRIYERQNDKGNIAITLGNIASCRRHMGRLRMAEADVARSISLSQEIRNEGEEAVSYEELSLQLAYRGAFAASQAALNAAEAILDRQPGRRVRDRTHVFHAMREVLRLRCAQADGTTGAADPQAAVVPARRALDVAEEMARSAFPHAAEFVSAHLILGTAYRLTGELDEATRHLQEALARCRAIDMVWHEGTILIELAAAALAMGQRADAAPLADEALRISERAGFVLACADASLVLARLARGHGDEAACRTYLRDALRLAACDGPPDYTYKAAYDEATALLQSDGTGRRPAV